MAANSIGTITQINRYPVKSFAGETVTSSAVETYGLYGDRCYAFIDETKEGWSSYITARTIPQMLTYKTTILNEPTDIESPVVKVTSPDGREFSWDEQLLQEIQPLAKPKITMKTFLKPEADLLAMDAGSILIITNASLRKLEALWGKPLDSRRFRANLIVALDENSIDESNWIGKRLRIGSAELQVDSFCERCTLITTDPDTLEKDSTLLRKVNEEMKLSFGVYASVIQTGQIQLGEKVYLDEN